MTRPIDGQPAPQLLITRGLPGSGKTTRALQWLGDNPERARVNRDDLRKAFHGKYVGLDHRQENRLTARQHNLVEGFLRDGIDVVVDDMHLRARYVRDWQVLADRVGARLGVWDCATPVDVCVSRDMDRAAAGGRYVGGDVIRRIAKQFHVQADGTLPDLPDLDAEPTYKGAVPRPYVMPEPGTLPDAWLFDVDGTLADMAACGRSPFDWHRVGEDTPVDAVIRAARAHHKAGDVIIVMSGRDGVSEGDTVRWLNQHDVPWDHLFMRAAGDQRKDSIVKGELFDTHVRDRFRVHGVYDDRDQVVQAWRLMGLPCFQVAPGNF